MHIEEEPMHMDIVDLRRGFAGQIVLPDEAGYNQARRVWNAMVDRHPAVIARCAGTADVAAAVRFGRGRGLEIGVRGGGHNIAGLAVPAGGLMIDLSLMGAVRVDPGRRRGWVQGGALLHTDGPGDCSGNTEVMTIIQLEAVTRDSPEGHVKNLTTPTPPTSPGT